MKPSAIATQSFFSAYQNQNQKKKKKFGHQKTHRLVLNQGPYPRISSKMAIFAMTSFMGRILHIYFFFGHHLLRPNGFKVFYHCLKKCI